MAKHSETLNRLLSELIRVSIGTQANLSRLPSEAEWEELFEMAVKQSLVGVCFVGLNRLGADSDDFARVGMSEELFFNWMGMVAQINMRNEAVNKQCVALQKRLCSDGLRSCILKGQGVAVLYGDGLCGFRQSGDIDLWVDETKEKVIDYVMQKHPTRDFGLRHIQFRCFSDTEVELHWIPASTYNMLQMRRLGRYFDSERERQFTHRSNGLCVPTLDFQVMHQLLHVYGHYVYEGVGLRQMMDLYFAQMACASCEKTFAEYEKYHEVVGLFKKLGLMKFVAATQWVLQEVFGMPESVMLCAPDENEGRKLLDEILIGGNFGHHDERNHVAGESFVQRFFRRWGRKFRMFRFDPLGTFLMPFSRLKLELWMRKVRRRYGV